jgi:hypothetical protein
MSELLSFLPLAIVIGLVVIAVRAVMGFGRAGRPLICTTCGTQTRSPKSHTKGSILIEIVLWFALIVPGLIYSLWRLTTRQRVCPACGSAALIPLDTPAGQKLLQQYGSKQA